MARTPTSVRFTEDDMRVIERLKEHFGVSLLPVLQLAIRALAREAGIAPTPSREPTIQPPR